MRTIYDFTSVHIFLNCLLCRIPNLPQKIHQTSCSFGASPSRQIGLLQRFSSPQVMVTWSCLRKNMVGVFPLCKTSSGWWLQPLWKIWKSVGMIIPYMKWKIKHDKIHVWNHQPVIFSKFIKNTSWAPNSGRFETSPVLGPCSSAWKPVDSHGLPMSESPLAQGDEFSTFEDEQCSLKLQLIYNIHLYYI